MRGDGSAYAVLGLDPAADSAEIEQAYRRLIKQHHPDRAGGDAARAAEINHAYRELRAERNLRGPIEFHEDWLDAARPRRAWLLIALLLVVAIAALLLSQSRLLPFAARSIPGVVRHDARHGRSSAVSEPMEQPLNLAAIQSSALTALHLSRTRDEMALASASRDCQHQLRTHPSLLQLDRCAAFDDAVVELEDRDPLRDQGPFSELAVTGRMWSGATALSEDSVAIDGRFDRIRLQVELVLANAAAPAAGAAQR